MASPFALLLVFASFTYKTGPIEEGWPPSSMGLGLAAPGDFRPRKVTGARKGSRGSLGGVSSPMSWRSGNSLKALGPSQPVSGTGDSRKQTRREKREERSDKDRTDCRFRNQAWDAVLNLAWAPSLNMSFNPF